MKVKLINLTPHAVPIRGGDGECWSLPPSGQVARVSTTPQSVDTVEMEDGTTVPIIRQAYGPVVGLPAPTPGTRYIVSAVVRAALSVRYDLVSPEDLVRDDAGKIVGCEALEGTVKTTWNDRQGRRDRQAFCLLVTVVC